MKKYEIFISEALGENLEEEFAHNEIKNFSKITPVAGSGYSTPMLNNDVWPGKNTLYIIYTDDEDAIRKSVTTVKEQFPNEGIATFKSDAEEL